MENYAELFSAVRSSSRRPSFPIFICSICIEKLSHIIQEAVNCKSRKPVKIPHQGPPITHLMFADDIILFFRLLEHRLTLLF